MKLVIACLCLIVMPVSIMAAETIVSNPEVRTEYWQGKVLTASFRAGMCFGRDGKARGVLLLKHSNGQVDEYHLYGSIRGDEFELSHSSGHIFKGSLVSPDRMEGRVKLKHSISLGLKGERRLNVPLLAEDCAPLPQ